MYLCVWLRIYCIMWSFSSAVFTLFIAWSFTVMSRHHLGIRVPAFDNTYYIFSALYRHCDRPSGFMPAKLLKTPTLYAWLELLTRCFPFIRVDGHVPCKEHLFVSFNFSFCFVASASYMRFSTTPLQLEFFALWRDILVRFISFFFEIPWQSLVYRASHESVRVDLSVSRTLVLRSLQGKYRISVEALKTERMNSVNKQRRVSAHTCM